MLQNKTTKVKAVNKEITSFFEPTVTVVII